MMRMPARLLRRMLAAASLHYYRRLKRRHRGDVVAAFADPAGDDVSSAAWIPLSRWLAAAPGRERIMMLVGPRWNTAAVLAFTPLFAAGGRVTVDADEANRACRYWGLVAYDEGLRTIAALGNRTAGRGRAALELPPGRCFLALRYFAPAAGARFPEIRVDGELVAAPDAVGDEYRRYEEALRAVRRRRRFEYRLMHYHAWAMLRDRECHDEDTLRRHFLPVGNPETEFAFGAVAAGERIHLEPAAATDVRTHVTFYGIDSIPLAWRTLGMDETVTPPAPERGTYLVRRMHARRSPGDGTPLAVRTG